MATKMVRFYEVEGRSYLAHSQKEAREAYAEELKRAWNALDVSPTVLPCPDGRVILVLADYYVFVDPATGQKGGSCVIPNASPEEILRRAREHRAQLQQDVAA